MRHAKVSTNEDLDSDRLVSSGATRGWEPDRLVAARTAAGMTRGSLARRAGIGRSTIQLWETGRRMPQIDFLARVAQALGVPMSALLVVPVDERVPADLRNLRGLTQGQLAQAASVSKETVSAVELGEISLTDATTTAIATALALADEPTEAELPDLVADLERALREAHQRARARDHEDLL